ncbi:MAG TPA: hypothetical protein VN455_10860 [Methanotrichaceae archaeon]|nr:hypothetical protein [Methanotrichaceae archaeon]
MKMEKDRPKGNASKILEFISLLDKTDKQGGELSASGEIDGPFFSRAVYRCVIKTGLDQKSLRRRTKR